MSKDFRLLPPFPWCVPFSPVPSQSPQGLARPLLPAPEGHKPPPTPALLTFYNPTLGAPSHLQGALGPMEAVLAGLQEDEALCDSSFQTATLPAGLTARRPHEAAQAQPREAPSPPAAPAPLTQSLAAGGLCSHPLPGACASCRLGGAEAALASHPLAPT